ncbi:hypothetical protein [Cyanobium sp. ATX-6F1]|uniref:hypothetical protein n=1 Tax=Cyanobium sp. ATX-6F1 TaxID=3137388 RepID=UPI0039BE0DA5
MAPQKHWLRQLGINPGEWHEPVDDLEDLELNELQRSALLRAQLQDQALADRRAAEPPDWLALDRGRSQVPAGSGGLEAALMEGRWRTLAEVLEGLGTPHSATSRWQGLSLELDWRGSWLVLTHTARDGVAQRLDLWLRLLLAAAAGEAPAAGVLVARPGKTEDTFAEILRLEAPEADQARRQLEALLALREQLGAPAGPCPPRPAGRSWRPSAKRRAAARPRRPLPGRGEDSPQGNGRPLSWRPVLAPTPPSRRCSASPSRRRRRPSTAPCWTM